jgi:hypothetical protein
MVASIRPGVLLCVCVFLRPFVVPYCAELCCF